MRALCRCTHYCCCRLLLQLQLQLSTVPLVQQQRPATYITGSKFPV